MECNLLLLNLEPELDFIFMSGTTFA